MNGLPDPYPNDTHVVVRGRTLVITEHAPNADGWQYHGIPADLIGDVVRFSHDEAVPVVATPPPARRTPGLVIEGVEPVEPLRIGETTPEKNLIEALASWARGGLSSADLRATYLMFQEGTTV